MTVLGIPQLCSCVNVQKSAAQVMWLEENLRKTRQDLDNLQPQHETVTEVLGDLSALLQERLGGGPVSVRSSGVL